MNKVIHNTIDSSFGFDGHSIHTTTVNLYYYLKMIRILKETY